MRNYMNIINEALATSLGEHAQFEDIFVHWYFHPVQREGGTEVWQHMDDPSIGEYHLMSRGPQVIKVLYVYPPMPVMNREIKSLEEFKHHIAEITEDDINPVGMMKGAAKLQGIAADLRKNKGK